MLRHKRLLYLTANHLTAYSLTRSGLVTDSDFERNDQGIASFSTYVARTRNLYYLVVDVVEEDYHQDNIPYLGRSDRRQVISRKLAQRYRDSSLTLSLSLGLEKGERRNEKVLFASFSNTQQIQPWLNVLMQGRCRLVGIYSTALLAPALAKRANITAPRCLLVSVQQTGLRQSYVEDGKIRFSRVGRLNLEDAASVAATCAAESARLHQFLYTTRQLPQATTPIDVMVLAAGKYHAALAQTCRSSDALRFHVINADAQCRALGLKRFSADAPCDALFLHSAATAAPREQFAQEQHRHQYLLLQFGKGMYAAGLVILGASLAFAGVELIGAYGIRATIQSEQTQFQAISAEYARITATFPALPTTTENLKTTMTQFRTLEAQSASPANLFLEISKTLADFPQVELDRIDWSVGPQPVDATAKGAPKAATPAPAQAGAPASGPVGQPNYEIAAISAQVVGTRRADLRAITEMTSQFIGALRKRPGLEISNVHMPFDLGLENQLSGDIGSERTVAEDAHFAVTIARKFGK